MVRLRPVLVVHYHEISLKRGNRPLFLRHLRRNLESALADVGPAPVQQLSGRIVIDLEQSPAPAAVRDRVTRVFGVASATLAYRAPSTLDAMKAVLGRLLEGRSFPSFRISARRAFKTYPLTSGGRAVSPPPPRISWSRPTDTTIAGCPPSSARAVDRVLR
jgi:thiamine biosynthesis protein ThiI